MWFTKVSLHNPVFATMVMAAFVVLFGWRPADYWALTTEERDAIITTHNRRQRRR